MDFNASQSNEQLILNTSILNTFTNLLLREFFNVDYNDFIVCLLKLHNINPKKPKDFNFKFEENSYVLSKNEFLRNIRLLIIEKLILSNTKGVV